MANLYAFQTTNPNDLKASPEPVGLDNNVWLAKLSKEASLVVAAWGNHGSFLKRSSIVKKIFIKFVLY